MPREDQDAPANRADDPDDPDGEAAGMNRNIQKLLALGLIALAAYAIDDYVRNSFSLPSPKTITMPSVSLDGFAMKPVGYDSELTLNVIVENKSDEATSAFLSLTCALYDEEGVGLNRVVKQRSRYITSLPPQMSMKVQVPFMLSIEEQQRFTIYWNREGTKASIKDAACYVE